MDARGLPTLQQSLPIFQGVAGGQDMLRSYLLNQAQRQRNKAAPDLAQSLLAQRGAQTDLSRARIPLTQAQAQSEQYRAQHAPEFFELKKQIAANVSRNTQAREDFTKLQRQKMTSLLGNMLTRMANSPSGKRFLSDHPGFARNLLEGALGASEQFSAQAQLPAPGLGGEPSPQQQQPPMQQPMPQQPPMQQPMPQQPPMQQPPMQQPQRLPVTDEMVRGAQESTRSKLEKETRTTRMANQAKFANTFFKIAEQIDEVLPNVVKYVGIPGRAKLLTQKFLTAFGADFPALKDYDLYVNKLVPEGATELLNYFGSHHTDTQYKQMVGVIKPDMVWTNPKLFAETWKAASKYAMELEDIVKEPIAEDLKRRKINKLYDEKFKPIIRRVEQSQAGGAAPSGQNAGLVEAIKNRAAPNIPASMPGGTVKMTDETGAFYDVPQEFVNDAIKDGLRRSNG